jgi:hypothetical protein
MATIAAGNPGDAEFVVAVAFPEYKNDAQGRPVLAYDAAADETAYWTRRSPQGMTTPLTIILSLKMDTANANAVGFQVSIEAVTAGDTLDMDASTSFDTVNNSTSTTVPGTAGYSFEISITLTNNDGIQPGDYYRVAINRDGDGSAITDSATGDAHLLGWEIRDAA